MNGLQPYPKCIYVLECEDSKYYVGSTGRLPRERVLEHFTTGGSGWTKIYKPTDVLAVIEPADRFDEDKYTKIYMEKYGVDRVRGGSYVKVALPDFQLSALKLELATASGACFKCGQSGHFAAACTACERCGRAHDTAKCYAKTRLDGTLLSAKTTKYTKTTEPKSAKRKQVDMETVTPNPLYGSDPVRLLARDAPEVSLLYAQPKRAAAKSTSSKPLNPFEDAADMSDDTADDVILLPNTIDDMFADQCEQGATAVNEPYRERGVISFLGNMLSAIDRKLGLEPTNKPTDVIRLRSGCDVYLCVDDDDHVDGSHGKGAPSEYWTMEHGAGATVSLRSYRGKYLCAEPDGRVIANRTKRGPWEYWTLTRSQSTSPQYTLKSCHGGTLHAVGLHQIKCFNGGAGVSGSWRVEF